MERKKRNIVVALIAAIIAVAVLSSFGLGLFAPDTAEIVLPTPAPSPSPGGESGGAVRVEVTPDLDVAKVHISMMGKQGGTAEAVQALNKAAGFVRTEISRRMHIRKSPRFVFVADDGAAYAAHINELLAGLHQQDADTDGEETDDE